MATSTSLLARFKSASAASRAALALSADSTDPDITLSQLLPAFIDAFGIGKVGVGLVDTRRDFLQVCLRLLLAGLGAGDHRLLLAVVEAGQHGALADAVADIGFQLDQQAGNLETDLGGNARFDRAEAEHLHRHIARALRDLHLDRANENHPGAEGDAAGDSQHDDKRDKPFDHNTRLPERAG